MSAQGHARWRGVLILCLLSILAGGIFLRNNLPPKAAFRNGLEAAQQPRLLYLNPSAPIAQRVQDLVSRMTLREKVLQMQHTAPAIPRLGIPSYDWWSEGLHGVARAGVATVFPQAIGMAATWDAPLIHREARVISTEARAKYNQAQREDNHSMYYGLTFWAPNINIVRDPRWGRSQETYGEDPFLTGHLAVAYVTGMQGNNPKYLAVVATPKHFALYSGPEPLRHQFSANASMHDIEATYFPAFRLAITEGHADSVMCSYNAVNGVPSCANPFLLQKTLRGVWHFGGYVTSDCGAVDDIAFGHHYAKDLEHASVDAVLAGTDTTCATGVDEFATLVKAVHDGLIRESKINQAVTRLFTARFRLGMFDPPADVPFDRIPMAEVDSPAHRALALQVARESMVLLKNEDGILPLSTRIKTIAVVGPNAESLPAIEGNYHGVPSHPVLPVEGMIRQFMGKARVLYAQGSPYDTLLPIPVPRTAFHLQGKRQLAGLEAEYFSNPDFQGKPAFTRVDPQVQFDWNASSPVPGIGMKGFSVRWTGTLTPPGPGRYIFGIEEPNCFPCEDHEAFELYIDGKRVLSGHSFNRQAALPTYTVDFAGSRPHQLRLDYSHRSPLFGAGITLNWKPPVAIERDQAVKMVKMADVAVAFVGLSPHLEGEEMPLEIPGFAGGDRTTLSLPPVQKELLTALAATGKPLVVVLMNGSALAVDWVQQHAAAILEAWYPGEAGGTAIAETLAGKSNPAGRLPLTFYTSVNQLPPFEDYSMANRTYRYFRGQPLYRFGYGLSYSRFSFSHLHLSTSSVAAGSPLVVTAEVQNISRVPGDEVAELYLKYPPAHSAPLLALKGFTRIHLAAGESRRVTFNLTPRDLSTVTEQGQRRVEPGTYSISVGGGEPVSGVAYVRGSFQIAGEMSLPR